MIDREAIRARPDPVAEILTGELAKHMLGSSLAQGQWQTFHCLCGEFETNSDAETAESLYDAHVGEVLSRALGVMPTFNAFKVGDVGYTDGYQHWRIRALDALPESEG